MLYKMTPNVKNYILKVKHTLNKKHNIKGMGLHQPITTQQLNDTLNDLPSLLNDLQTTYNIPNDLKPKILHYISKQYTQRVK